MSVFVKLRSRKKNEINKFLSKFYNTDMQIPNELNWKIQYNNPVEISEIIGVFIDNIDFFDLKMWICIDKNVYINITDLNGNSVIKYLFERFPY